MNTIHGEISLSFALGTGNQEGKTLERWLRSLSGVSIEGFSINTSFLSYAMRQITQGRNLDGAQILGALVATDSYFPPSGTFSRSFIWRHSGCNYPGVLRLQRKGETHFLTFELNLPPEGEIDRVSLRTAWAATLGYCPDPEPVEGDEYLDGELPDQALGAVVKRSRRIGRKLTPDELRQITVGDVRRPVFEAWFNSDFAERREREKGFYHTTLLPFLVGVSLPHLRAIRHLARVGGVSEEEIYVCIIDLHFPFLRSELRKWGAEGKLFYIHAYTDAPILAEYGKNHDTLGFVLWLHRKCLGLDRRQMAERCRLIFQNYTALEENTFSGTPPILYLHKLAQATGIDFDEVDRLALATYDGTETKETGKTSPLRTQSGSVKETIALAMGPVKFTQAVDQINEVFLDATGLEGMVTFNIFSAMMHIPRDNVDEEHLAAFAMAYRDQTSSSAFWLQARPEVASMVSKGTIVVPRGTTREAFLGFSLSEALFRHRVRFGLSRIQMAKRIGYHSYHEITAHETFLLRIKNNTIPSMAKALRMDPRLLFLAHCPWVLLAFPVKDEEGRIVSLPDDPELPYLVAQQGRGRFERYLRLRRIVDGQQIPISQRAVGDALLLLQAQKLTDATDRLYLIEAFRQAELHYFLGRNAEREIDWNLPADWTADAVQAVDPLAITESLQRQNTWWAETLGYSKSRTPSVAEALSKGLSPEQIARFVTAVHANGLANIPRKVFYLRFRGEFLANFVDWKSGMVERPEVSRRLDGIGLRRTLEGRGHGTLVSSHGEVIRRLNAHERRKLLSHGHDSHAVGRTLAEAQGRYFPVAPFLQKASTGEGASRKADSLPAVPVVPAEAVLHLRHLVSGQPRVANRDEAVASHVSALFLDMFPDVSLFKGLPILVQEDLIDIIDLSLRTGLTFFRLIPPAHASLSQCFEDIGEWKRLKDSPQKAAKIVDRLFTHLHEFEETRKAMPARIESSRFSTLQAFPQNPVSRLAANSDIGGVPATLLIGMPEDMRTANLFSRIFIMGTYLSLFPDCRVIISIGSEDAHYLYGLLADMIPSSQRERIRVVPEREIAHAMETRLEWFRDGVMLARHPRTGGTGLWVNEELNRLASDTMRAFGKATRAKRADFFFSSEFEGGQYVSGADLVLVGIDELTKYAGLQHLDLFNLSQREQTVQAFADGLGKRAVFVGDLVHGQALYHIDLYMTRLPNGTVAVTDFRQGLNFLKSLSRDDLNDMIKDYSQRMVVFEEEETDWNDSFYLPLLIDLRDNGPLRQRVEKWTRFLQRGIDREITQLKEAGFQVRRIPGFPFLTTAGGLTYTNVNFHEDEDGNSVMVMPGYSPRLDPVAVNAYRRAGYRGKIIPVQGIPDLSLKYSGGIRCATVVHGKKPMGRRLAVSAHRRDTMVTHSTGTHPIVAGVNAFAGLSVETGGLSVEGLARVVPGV